MKKPDLTIIGRNALLLALILGTIEAMIISSSHISLTGIILFSIVAYLYLTFSIGLLALFLSPTIKEKPGRLQIGMTFGLVFILVAGLWGNINFLNSKTAPSSLFFDLIIIIIGVVLVHWFINYFPIREKPSPGSKIRWYITPTLLILGTLTVVYYLFSAGETARNKSKKMRASGNSPNVLIVTLDTLRTDHLSIYGALNETSPFLSSLAQEGIVFENAYSQANLTHISHASIMTGQQPFTHGLEGIEKNPEKEGGRLSEKTITIAEIMRGSGYETAGFVSGWLVHSNFGFDQGFNAFYDDFKEKYKGSRRWMIGSEHNFKTLHFLLIHHTLFRFISDFTGLIKPLYSLPWRISESVNRDVFEWMDSKPERPLFLWVHYFDPHHPYAPPDMTSDQVCSDLGAPKDVSVEQINKIFAEGKGYVLSPPLMDLIGLLYDREIMYTDKELKKLWDRLENEGITDNLLVVITADHGESLWQHNECCHGFGLYEEQLHVPLIFWYPRELKNPRRISSLVRNIDILPTVLDIVNIKKPLNIDGVSLMPLLTSTSEASFPELTAYAATFSQLSVKLPPSFTVRNDKYRYIWSPDSFDELYDVRNDPGEINNLAGELREEADEMKKLLFDVNPQLENLSGNWKFLGNSADIPEDVREKLKALGYLH